VVFLRACGFMAEGGYTLAPQRPVYCRAWRAVLAPEVAATTSRSAKDFLRARPALRDV